MIPEVIKGYATDTDPGVGTHYYTIIPTAGDTWEVHYVYVSSDTSCTAITIEDFNGANIVAGVSSVAGGPGALTLDYTEHDNSSLRRWLVDNSNCYIRIKISITGASNIIYKHKATKIVD